MQNNHVRGPLKKSGDHEQPNFVIVCLLIRYEFGLFAVRCPVLLHQILRFAQNDSERTLRMTVKGHSE